MVWEHADRVYLMKFGITYDVAGILYGRYAGNDTYAFRLRACFVFHYLFAAELSSTLFVFVEFGITSLRLLALSYEKFVGKCEISIENKSRHC